MAEHYWWIDSSKAEPELGFAARDPQLTLVDTVRYLRQGVEARLTRVATIARFAVGETRDDPGREPGRRVANVEHVVWSERDRCHYFYLEQPPKKLSRGYRADELGEPTLDLDTLG